MRLITSGTVNQLPNTIKLKLTQMLKSDIYQMQD